jgi:hypothetical protein
MEEAPEKEQGQMSTDFDRKILSVEVRAADWAAGLTDTAVGPQTDVVIPPGEVHRELATALHVDSSVHTSDLRGAVLGVTELSPAHHHEAGPIAPTEFSLAHQFELVMAATHAADAHNSILGESHPTGWSAGPLPHGLAFGDHTAESRIPTAVGHLKVDQGPAGHPPVAEGDNGVVHAAPAWQDVSGSELAADLAGELRLQDSLTNWQSALDHLAASKPATHRASAADSHHAPPPLDQGKPGHVQPLAPEGRQDQQVPTHADPHPKPESHPTDHHSDAGNLHTPVISSGASFWTVAVDRLDGGGHSSVPFYTAGNDGVSAALTPYHLNELQHLVRVSGSH